MSCQEYVQFDKSSLPNYFSEVIHDKTEPPQCQDELKKKGFAWKINGNRTKFLDCLNNSCSSGKTETCDYRDQFYLNDASKLKSYTATPVKQKLKKPDFFLQEMDVYIYQSYLKQLLNPTYGMVDKKTTNIRKDNILYKEGQCFYPISDAGANERLKINGETHHDLDNWKGKFWMKIPRNKFLKENNLITGIDGRVDAINYTPLQYFIKYGNTYLIPKEKEGGKRRRVSRKNRSQTKRSRRY